MKTKSLPQPQYRRLLVTISYHVASLPYRRSPFKILTCHILRFAKYRQLTLRGEALSNLKGHILCFAKYRQLTS
jgi:hypothetical protein